MSIQVGERVPEVTLQRIGTGIEPVHTAELFRDRRVLLFAVPGAFTPTCSEKHLPGYVQHMQAFRDRGVDVACLSVNDPFVMQAWARSQGVPDDMLVLADGNGDLTRAMGLEIDASAYGMGRRARRFALYAVDGVVTRLEVEAPGEYRVSSPEHMLQLID